MMTKPKVLFILLLLSLFSLQLFAQGSETKTIRPIQLDRAALSGLGLKQIKLKQEPERKFFQRNLYRGEDISVYIVSSQSWTTRMENFSIDEYVYIFHGKSRAKADGGEDLFFQSGEHFAIPKGFTGEWEVKAADNIHYELSVITTQRAPEVKRSKGQLPKLFNKDVLSGIQIDWEGRDSYQEELFLGDELRISVKAEKPMTAKIDSPAKEQLISLLSGHLILTDTSGETHKFYAGDLFIIPKGFTGHWESQGHTLAKYLVIEQTN
ncbi:MAG: cupin domain-containing protein [Bacteroidota bacterium]